MGTFSASLEGINTGVVMKASGILASPVLSGRTEAMSVQTSDRVDEATDLEVQTIDEAYDLLVTDVIDLNETTSVESLGASDPWQAETTISAAIPADDIVRRTPNV